MQELRLLKKLDFRMFTFTLLESNNDLKEIIQSAFDAQLHIDGSWGYQEDQATIIHSTEVPISQFEHMFASMRAYTEMNMTKEPHERYGSINLNEVSREVVEKESKIYHKIQYKITAMQEDSYATFINAYKEGYGKETFNISEHFKQREEATLSREVTHWFEVSQLS